MSTTVSKLPGANSRSPSSRAALDAAFAVRSTAGCDVAVSARSALLFALTSSGAMLWLCAGEAVLPSAATMLPSVSRWSVALRMRRAPQHQ